MMKEGPGDGPGSLAKEADRTETTQIASDNYRPMGSDPRYQQYAKHQKSIFELLDDVFLQKKKKQHKDSAAFKKKKEPR